ncbi:MAG TPA: MotE family protein [Methylovirgula sp.]|jgi:flagellar motility protein MotE (MotC chaperone)
MWKVSFIPLLFACVGLVAYAPAAWAIDPEMPADTQPVPESQHHQRVAHHARYDIHRRVAEATQAATAPAAQPAALPFPQLPNPIAALQRNFAAAQQPQQPSAAPPQPQQSQNEPAPRMAGQPGQPQSPQPQPSAAPKPAANPQETQHAEAKPKPLPREVQQYCANNANAAVDARVAWEAAKLAELETRLRTRIAEFEAKRAEYEDWLHRHDEAMKQAKEDVVSIYSHMAPEAAASQLAVMDDVTAASVLTKLNSRNASAILAEMDPGRAARIAGAMVGPINTNAPTGKKS